VSQIKPSSLNSPPSRLAAQGSGPTDYGIAEFEAPPLWIRPHLIPPNRTIATIEAAQANVFPTGGSTIAVSVTRVAGQPGAWITSSGAVNAAGQPVTAPAACESALPHVLGRADHPSGTTA
jgi:hypothetical protein